MKPFLWGSATAAYQCEGGWREGGKGLSNWDVFCHSEKNYINPVTGDISCDHFHRYEEDIRMLAQGGQNAYRFSIAWTRIIPEGTGEVSREGIEFYNRLIDTCIRYNVEPLVTLYHYDLPQTLFEKGGWEERETAYAYAEYAAVCFEAFHDRIKLWATVNEPGYETLCCYGFGNYPPNVSDLGRRWRAMYHIMLASALAVERFREKNYTGKIGLVSDSYSIETRKDTPEYIEAARLADLFYNRSVNDVCVMGNYPQELTDQLLSDGYDLGYMKEADRETFRRGTVDFLGVNAYNRILVKPCDGSESALSVNNTGDSTQKNTTAIKNWFIQDEDPGTPKNPWGSEIYPKSVYNLMMDLNARYPELAVIITENGIGFYDEVDDGKVHDTYRIEYLAGYLEWIRRAIRKGCRIKGYFVWSTMDLYSWINGYKKRYGLVYVDYSRGNLRIPKDSYYWYKNYIEKEGGTFDEKTESTD